jgi:endonuclease/exonuclease/phosphatase family metal-dependent hydrolase
MLWDAQRRVPLLAFGLTLIAAALPAPTNAARSEVSVMTRNLYVGADLSPIFIAAQTDPNSVPAAASRVFGKVLANNFPARAQAIAAEVAANKPDVIGLQEVSQYYSGPFNNPAPADQPVLDYLELFAGALAAHGLHYAIVAPPAVESNQEVPVGSTPQGPRDIRLRVSNVMLARTDRGEMSVANLQAGEYVNRISVLGQPLRRNWQTVDVTIGANTVRVLNTHLEASEQNDAVRTAQASELAAGPLRATVPLIAAGDFNSDPGTRASGDAYGVLTSPSQGKLRDAWTATQSGEIGLTCCRGELLSVANAPLEHRFDLVLAVPQVRPQSVTLTGTQQVSGLYPSDHAGVVGRLTLP